MGEVPAGEGNIDRLCEVAKGVGRADDEDAAWRRLEVNAVTAEEIDPYPQPRPHDCRGYLRILRPF